MNSDQTFNFSNDRAFNNAFLVYIHGIEIPVQSASIRQEIGALPMATLQLAPDPKLARLGMEDRVEVQVFYKDNFFSSVKGVDSEFCLLFDGTIEGWSYSHNAFGRTISFQVSHSSEILQSTGVNFLTGLNDSVNTVANNEKSAGYNANAPGPLGMTALLFTGIDGKSILTRPYDLIANFFKSCLSKEVIDGQKSVVNAAFLNRLIQRRGLLYQFIPSPILEFEKVQPFADTKVDPNNAKYRVFPLLGMAEAESVVKMFGDRVQEMGTGTKIWNIIEYVYSQMFYELGTIMAPPIAQVDFKKDSSNYGLVIGQPQWAASPVSMVYLANKEKDYSPWKDPLKPNFLINHITKPQWMFGIAPACNVVFPSMAEDLSFSESYSEQPTRMYVDNKDMFDGYNLDTNTAYKTMATLRGAYPEWADSEIQKQTKDKAITGQNLLIWPAEFFRGPQTKTVSSPGIILFLKQDALNSATVEEMTAMSALDYINSRVESVTDIAMAQAQNEAAQGADRAKILEAVSKKILDEEQVLLDELKKVKILDSTPVSVSDLQEKLKGRMNTKLNWVKSLLRRFAQYEYFRYGAGARSGQVSMPFNPYITVGFPTVIFNSDEDGNHFVGYVVGVEHQLSASSMRTSVSFVLGQTMDEFLQNIFDARIGNNLDGLADDVSAAPVHPVNVLREVMQFQLEAETYFSRVFHQNQEYSENQSKSAAFDIFKAIRFVVDGDPKTYSMDDVLSETSFLEFRNKLKRNSDSFGEEFKAVLEKNMKLIYEHLTEHVGLTGPALESAMADRRASMTEMLTEQYRLKALKKFLQQPRRNPANRILDSYTAIVPSEEFDPMCKSYETAMRYVSRPVCTLDEYVMFRGRWGFAVNKVEWDNPHQGKGAKFYERILTFQEGPFDSPKFDVSTNIPINPSIDNLSESRLAWSKVLLNYRNLFLYGKVPTNTDGQT